jgi:hypothetical protein
MIYAASPSPFGDPFWVDYVSHEIGHAFAGRHTFNGTRGRCSNNRSSDHAFEPGGGTTIMAYGGICENQSVQPTQDPYFHGSSVERMNLWLRTLDGICSRGASANNLKPLPEAGPAYTIPARTPFYLSGAAVDDDVHALTYTWEQVDLGPASPPDTDDGRRPLFRSFPPGRSGRRYFPSLAVLRSGATSGPFEALPTTTRLMKFRLTVRDNDPDGGGVAWDETTISVVDTGAAFAVTEPAAWTHWVDFASAPVRWNVAGTDRPPVSCPRVDIKLSLDGAFTFPHVLASQTPNDGQEIIRVPAMTQPLNTAHVWVECSTAPFFSMSRAFTISRDVVCPKGYICP